MSQVAGSGTLLTATGGLPYPVANRLLIGLPTLSAQAGVKLDQVGVASAKPGWRKPRIRRVTAALG